MHPSCANGNDKVIEWNRSCEQHWRNILVKTKTICFILAVFAMNMPLIAQNTRVAVQRATNGVNNPLSFGLRLSYYAPKTGNVGGVFNKLEDSVGLPHGSAFHIYYLLGANLRCSLGRRNDVGVEGEVSYGQSKLSNVFSFDRLYSLNIQYYYHLQERKPGFYGIDIGGGVGWQGANFERNYGDNSRRIAVFAQALRLNGAVQWWAALSRSLYLELDARYVYVPTIRISNPQTSITMSSFQMSAGFSVVL